jgi:DNA-binding CsgD family transcriptional regulator
MHDDPTLKTLGRIAGLGMSVGPVEPLARQALQELAAVAAYRGGLLCGVDHATGARRVVAECGCTPELLEYAVGAALAVDFDGGWPIRGRLDALGYPTLLLSSLAAGDGRRVGFLLLAGNEGIATDEAVAVVGHSAPVLAAILDPVRSAADLASGLGERGSAVAVLPTSVAVILQGPAGDDLLDADSPLRRAAVTALAGGRRDAAFLWAGGLREWFGCRVFRCHDGVVLITVSERRDLHCLTRRELEVLSHLAGGASNAEIAARLWVTPRTVRAHVEQIMLKLDVSSRTGAVARALDEGLRLAS